MNKRIAEMKKSGELPPKAADQPRKRRRWDQAGTEDVPAKKSSWDQAEVCWCFDGYC